MVYPEVTLAEHSEHRETDIPHALNRESLGNDRLSAVRNDQNRSGQNRARASDEPVPIDNQMVHRDLGRPDGEAHHNNSMGGNRCSGPPAAGGCHRGTPPAAQLNNAPFLLT